MKYQFWIQGDQLVDQNIFLLFLHHPLNLEQLELKEIKIPCNKPHYIITINRVQYKFTNILKTDYPYKGYRMGNMVLDDGKIGKVVHSISPKDWETRQKI